MSKIIFIHREVTFYEYNHFFSIIKSSLCSKHSVENFEIWLGKDMIIGSDEEKALVNAIATHLPASNHFLCTKHLKDRTAAYMQTKVGVPQKERKIITRKIFGEGGILNANDTAEIDAKAKVVLKDSVMIYPKFVTYFKDKLKPTLEAFVNDPARKIKPTTSWTNNNCESLNHIMKLDADWKVHTTPALINLLHEMTQLHFKGLRRSLYGEGNYRLYGKFATKYFVRPAIWVALSREQRERKFQDFLDNKRFPKEDSKEFVKSTWSKFRVPVVNITKKPGQRTRPKETRTAYQTKGNENQQQ